MCWSDTLCAGGDALCAGGDAMCATGDTLCAGGDMLCAGGDALCLRAKVMRRVAALRLDTVTSIRRQGKSGTFSVEQDPTTYPLACTIGAYHQLPLQL